MNRERRNEKDSIHKTQENVTDGWRKKKKNKRKKTNKSKDFGTNEDLKSPDIEGRTEKKLITCPIICPITCLFVFLFVC